MGSVDSATAIVASIALFSIAVTCGQVWLGLRMQRLDATFRMVELMQDPGAREARFALRSMLEAVEGQPNGYAALTPTDRANISGIALLFGLAGSLARNGRIEIGIFLDAYGLSVVQNHKRLQRYAQWCGGQRVTANGSLWKDFDWIAARAEAYISKKMLSEGP